MTISAFGVDHGEISKSLPSALKGKKPELWSRHGYARSKLAAHRDGQRAGRLFAQAKKQPNAVTERVAENSADMGRQAAFDAKLRLNSKGSKRIAR